jgi:hypothetical protein
MKQTTLTATPAVLAAPGPRSRPIPLSQLRAGTSARLHAADLNAEDCAFLRALGLTDRCLLRVCKAGEPCIVQVHATRIGLSREVARGLLVIPEAAA